MVTVKLVVLTRIPADDGFYRCVCEIRNDADEVIGDATVTLPMTAEEITIVTEDLP